MKATTRKRKLENENENENFTKKLKTSNLKFLFMKFINFINIYFTK